MVTETDPGSPVNADMWRAIGRLEGATGALLEGQREIKAGLEETQREFRRKPNGSSGLPWTLRTSALTGCFMP